MQELSARNAGHEFSVDGGRFFLPPLSITDVGEVQKLAGLQPIEQAAAMGDLLQRRAVRVSRWRFWLDPAKAVASLGLKQQSELFTAWAAAGGIGMGESKSSGN